LAYCKNKKGAVFWDTVYNVYDVILQQKINQSISCVANVFLRTMTHCESRHCTDLLRRHTERHSS